MEIEAKTEKDLESALQYFNIRKDMLFNGNVFDLRNRAEITDTSGKRKNL